MFSADHVHVSNGVYRYDPALAARGHKMCLQDYTMAVVRIWENQNKREKGVLLDKEHIVVDNTNTTLAELSPYVRLAEAFQQDYVILYIMCPVEVSLKRNIHSVPANTILRMHANLLTECAPPNWNQHVLFGDELPRPAPSFNPTLGKKNA